MCMCVRGGLAGSVERAGPARWAVAPITSAGMTIEMNFMFHLMVWLGAWFSLLHV